MSNDDKHGEPLPLIAEELRDIAAALEESDAIAWRGRIRMLREMADDLSARSSVGTTELCAGHADAWYTGRNHLHGGVDQECVVCAFAPPSATVALDPVTEGTVEQDAERFRYLARHVQGTLRQSGYQYRMWFWSTENIDHNMMRAIDAARATTDGGGA